MLKEKKLLRTLTNRFPCMSLQQMRVRSLMWHLTYSIAWDRQVTGEIPSYRKWKLSSPHFIQEYFVKMKLGEIIFIYLFTYLFSITYLKTFPNLQT